MLLVAGIEAAAGSPLLALIAHLARFAAADAGSVFVQNHSAPPYPSA